LLTTLIIGSAFKILAAKQRFLVFYAGLLNNFNCLIITALIFADNIPDIVKSAQKVSKQVEVKLRVLTRKRSMAL